MQLDLAHTSIAAYEWGSLRVRFPAAPVDRRSMGYLLAELAANSLPWKSAAEARASIALHHELVHYAQDLGTGVGHDDALQRARARPGLLDAARAVSWGMAAPGGNAAARPVAVVEEARPPADRAAHEAHLRTLFSPVDDFARTATSVIGILEADAALQVFRSVRERNIAADWDLVHDEVELWNPLVMAEPYHASLVQVAEFVRFDLEASGSSTDEHVVVQLSSALAPFFFDAALAYPPPGVVERSGVARSYFHPGVKLMYLLNALYSLGGSDHQAFYEAIWDRDPTAAERALLTASQVAYPDTRSIYEAWAKEMEQAARTLDDRVLRLRTDAICARLDDPAASVWRPIEGFVFGHELPIFIAANDPSQGDAWESVRTGRWLYGDDYAELAGDMTAQLRDERLVALFLRGEPMRCPLRTTCEAAVVRCWDGLSRLADLPPPDGCSVRAGLERVGFDTTWAAP